jgi:hypothetical protein
MEQDADIGRVVALDEAHKVSELSDNNFPRVLILYST